MWMVTSRLRRHIRHVWHATRSTKGWIWRRWSTSFIVPGLDVSLTGKPIEATLLTKAEHLTDRGHPKHLLCMRPRKLLQLAHGWPQALVGDLCKLGDLVEKFGLSIRIDLGICLPKEHQSSFLSHLLTALLVVRAHCFTCLACYCDVHCHSFVEVQSHLY